jgi:alpha-L-arabinofuranosidase
MKKSFPIYWMLLICLLLRTNLFAQDITVKYDLNINKTEGLISPLWFGHNLEHTRSAMWHGLSAQLIQNRKFGSKPEHTGQAIGWDVVGPNHTWFYLSDNSYTTHYNNNDSRRRRIERQSQLIENLTDSLESGISQQGIHLTANTEYEGRIILKCAKDIKVSVSYVGSKKVNSYFTKDLLVKSGDWNEFRYNFTSPETDENTRVKISFKQKNVLFVGTVSLLPADNFYGMRRDVIARLKQISTPILRWPGGNFAGEYRWQDGLLPCDMRAPLMAAAYMEQETQPYTYGRDNHEVGTDEYIQLCREIGAEPFITVNLAWEDPELCASWVEYCNGSAETKWGQIRAKQGHPEPYHVKYWSLGNELLGSHMEGGFDNNPGAYATKIKTVAEAMLKSDPTILLTMSGYLDSPNNMSSVLPYLNSISYHAYTLTTDKGIPVLLNNDLFMTIVKNPANNFMEIKNIYHTINQMVPGTKPVSISFDEWNLWYSWNNIGNVRTGIYTASMLNEFCREALQCGINIGCYFQPINEGAIEVRPDSSWLTATGQVFELYKEHHNNIIVPINQKDSTISIASSLNQKTKELIITAVNLSPENDKKISISLIGIKKTSLVKKSLYYAENYFPGSKFIIKDLPVMMKNDKVEFALPRNCISNIVISLSRN